MRKTEYLVRRAINCQRRGYCRLSKFYCYILRILFACDFSGEVDFAPSAQLIHNGLGCVFHPKSKIGENCKIYQNVTLGGNGKIIDGVTQKGGPTLENNVAVFAGACVLGPITIGHDTIIGANAVVTKDIPPHSLVFGNPAIVKELTFEYDFGK